MIRKIQASIFLFFVGCALLLPTLSVAQSTTIQVAGVTRTMYVYAPSGLLQNRPLLISLHGLNQSADYQRNQAKWEQVADTAKFVVVYPTAINLSWDISGDRDINFILAIIDAMATRYQIDRSRVYVSGFSMGGMMSYHVANKIADKVAAIGPVSGYLFSNVVSSSRPMPLIHVHGTTDDVVVYSGVAGVIQKWRTWNQCPSSGTTTRPYPSNKPSSQASLQYWGPCNNSAVALITLDGKGHWHSNDAAGVHTTVEIWNFVRRYSLSGAGPVISFTQPANNASFSAGTTIALSVNATTPSGSITDVKFYNGTTLLGSDNSAPYSYNWTNVPAGTYTLRAVVTNNDGKTAEATVIIKVNVPQGPYNGTVHPIPGTIQLESYDVGGNGAAYLDNTPGSAVTPVVNFRTTEDVDIENCTDAGGGYNVGWATAGEWLEYTVNVQTTGTYDLDLRVACQGDGRTLNVSMDGTNIAANVAIPNTAGWQTWQTVRVSNISLTAGQKIMRVTIGATDYINLNFVTFTLSSPPVAAITAAGVTTFCAGGSVVLNANTATSYTYQWKRDGSNILNATASSYTATQTGSYTVTVSANSQSVTSNAVNVIVNAIPNAPGVTTPVTYCQNTTAAQLAASGTNLKWYTVSSGGASSATAPTPSTTAAGTTNYYVSQTASGCESARATIAATINALPVTSPYLQVNGGAWLQQSTATLCAGGSVVLGPQPVSATGWSWTGPNGFASAAREVSLPDISSGNGGVYTASYTSNGCSSTQTFDITVNALPEAVIAPSGPTTFVEGGNVTLQANTGTGLSYKWFDGTTQVGTASSYVASTTGSYTVEVSNASGCKATSSATSVSANQNQPSVISIVLPATNSTVIGPITISANVTDPDGGVTKVEYLDGTMVIGTSTSSPYSYIWDNPTAGDHVITVRVTDSNGGLTVSSSVTVTSDTPTSIQGTVEMLGKIYPNPTRDEMTIETAMDLTNAKVTLINVLGEEMEFPAVVNARGASIDVSSLAEGSYLLVIRKGNGVLKKKITLIK